MSGETLRLARLLRETARQWSENESGRPGRVTAITGLNDDPGTECYLFGFRIEVLDPTVGAKRTLTVTVDSHEVRG